MSWPTDRSRAPNRHGVWKLLADEALARLELYDLATYPYEVIDRASEEPEVLAAMTARLRGHAASVRGDPLLPSWVQSNREGSD